MVDDSGMEPDPRRGATGDSGGRKTSSTSSGGAAATLFVAVAFLCSGVPALAICAGMGVSLTDIVRSFFGS